MKTEIIAKVEWKSEDGYQFMGEAQGHTWDIVQTTSDKVRPIEVGYYVRCTPQCNEDWGNYLEEVAFKELATVNEWEEQEQKYK